MANGYTGKTMGVSFRLPSPVRRQAVEYLRSRGFEEIASEKVVTDAFALAWRDGGTFDLGCLRVRGTFAARNMERAFNKLGVSGLCDFTQKVKKETTDEGEKTVDSTRLCTIRLGLPVVLTYYTDPSARFIEIKDVGPPLNTCWSTKRKPKVVKWECREVDATQDWTLRMVAQGDAPVRQVPAAEAYQHFAKLRGGGAS